MKTQLYNTMLAATLGFALVAPVDAATTSIDLLGAETPERTINSTGTIANSIFTDPDGVDTDDDVDSTASLTVAWDMTLNSTTLSAGTRRTLWELGGGGTGFSATITNSGIFLQVQDTSGPTVQLGGNGSGDTSAVNYVVTAADLGFERSWVASVDVSGDLRLFVDGEMVAGVSGPAIVDWAGGDAGGFWGFGGGTVLTDAFTSGSGAGAPGSEATINTTSGLRLYEDLTTINVVPTFVATPAHSWVAGFNDDVGDDSTWHASVGTADINLSGGGEVLISSGLDALPFAYASPTGNNGVNSDAVFGGTGDATFEVVVRINDLFGEEILWEVGGTGSGSSLVLDENVLRLVSQTSNSTNRMTVTETLDGYDVGRWLHLVAVITETGGATDMLELFVDGTSVGTATIADASFINWAGGSPWGLGTFGDNFAGQDLLSGTAANFTGDIALFNHYAAALTDAQIFTQAVQFQIVPAPAALPAGLLMIVGLAARRRR